MRPTPFTHETTAAAIEAFVREIGSVALDDPAFDRTVDLYDTGYVDSLALVALLAFIEDTLQVRLGEDDLFTAEFTTINGIADILTRWNSSK
jgi:acyl carrier protein